MSDLDFNQIQAIASDLRAVSDATYPAKNVIADEYTSLHGYNIGEYCLRNSLLYKCNTTISSNGEVWNSNHWDEVNIGNTIQNISEIIQNKILYFTDVATMPTTGTIVNISDNAINSNHLVTSCIFAIPSYILDDISWTTSSGNLTLSGTCSSATTCNIILIKKDN